MTATPLRNITVDVANPTTIRDFTAVGVLDALTATTNDVPWQDVDASILAAGGSINAKGWAIKGLRNVGYSIIVHKARTLSWYRLAASPDEYADMELRVVREAYSQQITTCRLLAGAVAGNPSDPLLGASHNQAQLTACTLGQRLGMTLGSVLAESAPLPV